MRLLNTRLLRELGFVCLVVWLRQKPGSLTGMLHTAFYWSRMPHGETQEHKMCLVRLRWRTHEGEVVPSLPMGLEEEKAEELAVYA